MEDKLAIKNTIEQNKKEIITHLKASSLEMVAVALSDAGLMPQEDYETVRAADIKSEKATLIVESLFNQINKDPEVKFKKLVEVVEKDGELDGLVQFLKQKYGK